MSKRGLPMSREIIPNAKKDQVRKISNNQYNQWAYLVVQPNPRGGGYTLVKMDENDVGEKVHWVKVGDQSKADGRKKNYTTPGPAAWFINLLIRENEGTDFVGKHIERELDMKGEFEKALGTTEMYRMSENVEGLKNLYDHLQNKLAQQPEDKELPANTLVYGTPQEVVDDLKKFLFAGRPDGSENIELHGGGVDGVISKSNLEPQASTDNAVTTTTSAEEPIINLSTLPKDQNEEEVREQISQMFGSDTDFFLPDEEYFLFYL